MTKRLVSLEGLLMRPRPELGESWPGYLCRLADRNALAGVAGLVRVLKVSKGVLLCAQLASEPTEFALDVSDPSKGALIAALVVGRSWRSRICPICVDNENPISLARWDEPLALRCVQHDCMLIDRCDRCNAIIRHDRPFLASCACGKRFRTMVAQDIPVWVKTMEKVYVEASGCEVGSEVERVDNLKQVAAKAIKFLALFNTETMRPGKQRASDLACAKLESGDFAAMAKLFEEDPVGLSPAFRTWFAQVSEEDAKRILYDWKWSEFEKVGAILKGIRNKRPWMQRWVIPADYRNTHVLVSSMSDLLGISAGNLRTSGQRLLAEDIVLVSRELEADPLHLVALSCVDRIRSECATVAKFCQAASKLHVGETTVRWLVQSRVLERPNRRYLRHHVTFDSIEQLLKEVNRCVTSAQILPIEGIKTLAQALDQLAHEKPKLCAALLRNVGGGGIRLFLARANPRSLDDYGMRPADFECWSETALAVP